MTTDQITKEAEQSESALGTCIHYWIIDAPEGPVSQGVCRKCRAQREFFNLLGPDTRKPPGSL